ncbi:MAG TPA: hypothetical protein DCX17_01475 [Firmicutes bacterium]|nr:hypothetical protein [Bacillota bacterium]
MKMIIDILQISRDAREAKHRFDDVIDCSIGMFIDEDGFVGGLPVVFDAFKHMPPELLIPYPSVDGGQPFKDNVFKWVFQAYEQKIQDSFNYFVCATPGGSGAVAAVLRTQVPKGEQVLVSDIRWQYDRFSEPAGIFLHSHELFDGDKFNFASFKKELSYLCKKQNKVVVIVNDPCQNPSGYTLTFEEWEQILSILNEHSSNEIVLLYDIAYIDYSCEIDQRRKASALVNLKDHVQIFVTFSGSKTFGAYGMRMGALIGLSRKADFLKDAREKVLALARGMWSATPTPAIELLNLMFEEERKPDFLQGLAKARQTIIRRGHLFLKQAQEVDLPLVPYINGFYTIVKCPNSYACYEKLAKNHIYAVPVEQGIRIALCSLSLKDIDGLALKLKSIMFCS